MRVGWQILEDPGHLKLPALVHLEPFSNSVGGAEQFDRRGLGEQRGVQIDERIVGLLIDKGEREYGEERVVRAEHRDVLNAVVDVGHRDDVAENLGGAENVGELFLDGLAHAPKGLGALHAQFAVLITVVHDAVDLPRLRPKRVVVGFVVDVDEDDQCRQHGGGETENVDGGKYLVLPEIAEGDEQVVREHGERPERTQG